MNTLTDPNFTPYTKVRLILKKNNGNITDVDLSNFWSTIEHNEEIQQNIKVTLNAKFGQFLTKEPIIRKFDLLFLETTDSKNNVKGDVFHVRRIKRGRKAGKNQQLTLICPHESENLWKKTISLVSKRKSGFQTLNDIIFQLTDAGNIGLQDPIVEIPVNKTDKKAGNFLDQTTVNNYIFEHVKLETAFDEIANVEAQPVEGGGSFEPLYIRFISKYVGDDDDDLGKVFLSAFPQGFRIANAGQNIFSKFPTITLKHSPLEVLNPTPTETNMLTSDSEEDPERATNIRITCNKLAGTYPIDWSKFQGAKDVFNSALPWVPARIYNTGNLVTTDFKTFEAIIDHTSSGANEPPSNNWALRTFTIPDTWQIGQSFISQTDVVNHSEIAYKALQDHTSTLANEPPSENFWIRVSWPPTVEYSPLTKQRAQYWVNGLAGAKNALLENRTFMIDPNCIIDDPLHPRNPVDWAGQTDTSIPGELLVDGKVPDAFKVLVINTITGESTGADPIFSGNDASGLPFAGNIAEFVVTDSIGNGVWEVWKGLQTTTSDYEVLDWYEGLSWTKNACIPTLFLGIPDRFVNESGNCVFTLGGGVASRTDFWVKGAYRLSELLLIGKVGAFVTDAQFECMHSVKRDTINNRIDLGNTGILGDDTANDSAVFIKSEPTNTSGVFPFYVGFNFHSRWPRTSNNVPFSGTVKAGEQISLPTFDFNNMFRTADGSIEWFGPKSEEYLPIQSFAMWLQFIQNDAFFGTFDDTGDYAIGIWMADRRHNVRVIPFTQGRNITVTPQEAKLPGDVYKGVPGTSIFLSAEEPDTTDVFDPREFLMGGIYTMDSFDSQGRYLGLRSRFFNKNELELAIDGWRMIKPLLVTNVDEPNSKPDRNIELGPQPREESIISYAQAKNLVLGLAKWMDFDRDEHIITSFGRNDWLFGDPVYFNDVQMISSSDDGILNTVKGVIDKAIISFSKSRDGPGGFITEFHIVPRLYL